MQNYSRRCALKAIGATMASAFVMSNGFGKDKKKRHYITLSFDDGFKKSSIRTAELYEKYGLSACINVVATAHLPDFKLPNEYHRWPVGDFELWNDLKDRGHEIMMHGYKHIRKTDVSFEEGKDLITRCIDYFSTHLKGFDAQHSIFNFPHNASTPELEAWLPTKVRAFRTGGKAINDLPHKNQKKLTCTTFGPGNIEKHLTAEIDKLLALPEGWFIYNTHGLDDEGWGPMSSSYLDELLSRLTSIETVEVIPIGKALDRLAG